MRKHMSVFMLFIRSSLYKTIVLCLLMAAAQWGVYLFLTDINSIWLEDLADEGAYKWIFAAFSTALTLVLVNSCTGRKGKPVYTVARLSIRQRGVFFWQAVCNILLLVLLFSCEIFVMLGIAAHFVANAPETAVTSQSLFLAFYRSDFLHSLLPMEYEIRWARNIIMIFGMAVVCAWSSFQMRRGKIGLFALAFILVFNIFNFAAPMGEGAYDGMIIALSLLMTVPIIIVMFTMGEEVEDEEAEETP